MKIDFASGPPSLSISQIFLNKKRRNLKKGETIDRYSFERRNQGGGQQKNEKNRSLLLNMGHIDGRLDQWVFLLAEKADSFRKKGNTPQ